MNHLTFDACDSYMEQREGNYQYRSIRYKAACEKIFEFGVNNSDTIVDVGAGWTELDYMLRRDYDWRGRYIPIDAGIDGTNLEYWEPLRRTDYYVALEIIEHMKNPERLLDNLISTVDRGIVISVPNPETVDVLAIDDTHFSTPDRDFFESNGFTVEDRKFYGGVFSRGMPDALFAWKNFSC